MSSNFESGYDWSDDMQPQNLSRYPSDSTTTEELDYIHLFPSPLPESSYENLLKRGDFSAPPYQERPVNLAAVGDYRHIDMIYPELANFDGLHHSSTSSVNNTYGNYNIFTHIFPHNAPDSYIEDRFLAGLSATDLEGSGEHSGNFINNLEAQFCPPHTSPLIYSSGFPHTTGSEDVNEIEIPSPGTAVLDLSPTVSAINKPSQAEGFAPYLLSNGDAAKHQPKQNTTYSMHLFANETSSFKNSCPTSHSLLSVKYEPPNPIPDTVPLPLYEEPLLHYDVDHTTVGEVNQPQKLLNKVNKDVILMEPSCSDFLMEERSLGNRTNTEHVTYKEASSPYFGCEWSMSLCSPTRLQKVGEELETTRVDRVDNVLEDTTLQHRTHKYSSVELVTPFNTKENSKPLLNFNEQLETNDLDEEVKSVKPLKKSERIRKAKAFVRIEKEEIPTKQIQKVQKKKKKRAMTCRTCSAQFSESHSLKIHHYLHTGERPFRCDECGNRFTKNSSLSIHRLKHTGEKPHNCSTCGKSFRLFSTLKSHLLTHTGEKPFRCDLCPSKFTQRSALERHKKMHMNLKPFKCDVCDNSFRDKFYFKKHVACHEMKAKHSCEICGEGFYSNRRLQIHAMKHNDGPNPYKCNKCSAQFVSQKAWRQHKSRNHERKEELRCEDCDATFKRREYFNAHKKVHSGDNLVKCEFCQANFNNIGTLRKHSKKHENNSFSNDKKINCSNGSAKSVLPISSSAISFPCCKCYRTFSTRRQLRTHRCYDKFDDSAHISLSEKGGTSFDHNINEVSPLASRCDTLPVSLSSTDSSSSGKYKRSLVGVHAGDEVRLNNDMDLRVDFSQTTSEVFPLQSSTRNIKIQGRSDTPLIFTKSCDPPSLPQSQESNAANLLSAVLQVADSGFDENERRIS